MLLHCKTVSIHRLFLKNLGDLSIHPHTMSVPGYTNAGNASVDTGARVFPNYNGYRHLFMPAKIIVAVSVAIVSVLYFTHLNKHKPVANVSTAARAIPGAANNEIIKTGYTDVDTATISHNRIIIPEQSKKTGNMKKLIPAAVLLVSGLGFDTLPAVSSLPIDLTVRKQIPYTATELNNATISPVSKPEMHGTIYASRLRWFGEKYVIEVSGNKVRVDMNTQSFKGSGSFSFIDSVYFLVVDGIPVKLNETIKLAEKTYTFTQLSIPDAIKKYGDKGKRGAVEMAVVE